MLGVTILFLSLMSPSGLLAAQKSGGTSGGTSFACEGSTCICNGTYTDCKDMEEKCSGKINCPTGGSYFSCTRKAAARQKQLVPKLAPETGGALQKSSP